MQNAEKLPHWDMSGVYPGLDSPAFDAGFQACVQAIGALETLFEERNIGRSEPISIDADVVATLETLLGSLNEALEQVTTVRAYISSFVTTDSRNELAQAKMSEFQRESARLSLLDTRLNAWIGCLDVEALIAQSTTAQRYAHLLRQAAEQARHQMTPAEEDLATQMNLTGGAAWAKLHGTFSSQLSVELTVNGQLQTLPMSGLRNLASAPDRDLRRRAHEAELVAWEQAAVPLAAALNGVKGEVGMLARRRGWETPLDAALFDSGIDRPILEAMMTAGQESFPDFRRYLHAKARMLDIDKLAWYDLFAPVTDGGQTWAYDEATQFVSRQFHAYSPRMGALADRAFAENWIDAEPRDGKRGGAFCMKLRGDESRILANYKPVYGGLNTLAHELGHAYHGHVIAQRPSLQRSYPMTLAETASTFCETIVQQAALAEVGPEDQLVILESALEGACQVVVDISSRFIFESAVFDQRIDRELSVGEFNEAMLKAQRQAYGDGVDKATLHPYMWAVKPHYYSTGRSFYNFPYMFGLLFGLGLYAHYQHNPETFKAGYDDLLADTGAVPADELAARFDIDLRSVDFWRASLDVIREDIKRFEALA